MPSLSYWVISMMFLIQKWHDVEQSIFILHLSMNMAYDQTFMATAALWAKHSKCIAHQVGCVITIHNRQISNGYNGTYPGAPNCNEVWTEKTPDHHYWSLMHEVHAEANAIAACARAGISTNGSTLYTTLSPCPACASLIIQSGVTRVVYSEEYKISEGIDMLLRANVSVDNIVDKDQC